MWVTPERSEASEGVRRKQKKEKEKGHIYILAVLGYFGGIVGTYGCWVVCLYV
jgi:hypothetical protein